MARTPIRTYRWSIATRAIPGWNSLPNDITSAASVSSFRSQLTTSVMSREPKIRKKRYWQSRRRRRENRGAEGAEVECRRRENRGAVGAEGGGAWGGGVPSPLGEGSGIF